MPGAKPASVYLLPLTLNAGGPAFESLEILRRVNGGVVSERIDREALAEYPTAEQAPLRNGLEMILRPRAAICGLPGDRPLIMGILNVTPDSFSDGGNHADADIAVEAGLAMAKAGADIIDVGGESTRPGARQPSIDEEHARAIPVVARLAAAGLCVSIDTRRAAIMTAAIEAGARIVNDISALTSDPESMTVVAKSGVPVVLMHMQGTPETMQAEPTYDVAALDVFDFLEGRVLACEAVGIARDSLIVDPGIGFGKNLAHNVEILRHLALYWGLGCRIMIGVSRKGFIGRLSGTKTPANRVAGSLAAALHAVSQGAGILRVHDVAETAQALAVWQAISQSEQLGKA
jgi:dihydropteroate synthase